ncbi:MAG: UDP-glucuronate 5-epimerase [Candidatus Endolissoclinum sp. TMED37]|nr:MAG: UDP-glucuronate 5-epimerase [Candidatus Endolissoclinum sp. TMED37]
MKIKNDKTALVTGAAGFIGYFVASNLLENGWRVIGLDCISDYYDVKLKLFREKNLLKSKNYISIHKKVEDKGVLHSIFKREKPNVVIHLAAQAGVRYSLENPRNYLESNVLGTFELLEAAKVFPPDHILIASTSSVYGANSELPYNEDQRTDHPLSFYAATKKSTETMAHSYSHLFNLPVTIFRFFTVYGPLGRPDMAHFKFTDSVLKGTPIDVHNYGDMERDFTYIDDLVNAIILLIKAIPEKISVIKKREWDNLSSVAPYRVINIGNSKPVKLIHFIEAIEKATGKKAKKNMVPIQPGEVQKTWASVTLLKELVGYSAKTDLETGVKFFVDWYREYYNR